MAAPVEPGVRERPQGEAAAPSTPVRYAHIAYLRVFAICAVVAIHVSGLTIIQPRLSHTKVWWAAAPLNFGTRFSVPMFVVVSGALLLRERAMNVPLGQYYRTRLNRIALAVVVWHVVYVFFRLYVLDQHLTWRALASQILTGRVYTAMYFFWLILGLYVVAPLLWRVIADRSLRERLAIAVGCTAATCLWALLGGVLTRWGVTGLVPTFTVLTYWIPYVGFFLLGPALLEARVGRRAGLIWTAVALGGIAFSTLTRAYPVRFDKVNLLTQPGYFGSVTALTVVALFLAAAWWFRPETRLGSPPVSTFVDRLGSLTLGVFAMHLIILYALQHAPLLTVEKGASSLPELAYLGIATVVLSFLAAYVLSKVPLVRRIV
jgi:surface polysaccharide O-acyltransferase-like enzyme